MWEALQGYCVSRSRCLLHTAKGNLPRKISKLCSAVNIPWSMWFCAWRRRAAEAGRQQLPGCLCHGRRQLGRRLPGDALAELPVQPPDGLPRVAERVRPGRLAAVSGQPEIVNFTIAQQHAVGAALLEYCHHCTCHLVLLLQKPVQ